VNVFVIEPIRYACVGVAASSRPTSASPIARSQRISPPRNAVAETAGMRCAACAAVSRPSSSSGDDAGTEGSGDELAGALDVLVRQVEVRHSAEHRRMDRGGEADACFAELGERLVPREAE
jgi:hypothetical protein